MLIVIFGGYGDCEIHVMTWFAFVCFDILVSYPTHLSISVRLANWGHTFSCKKNPRVMWLSLTTLGLIDLYP